jgi:hypothetical protein
MSKLRACLLLSLGVLTLALTTPAPAGQNADSSVYPVNSHPYGASYAEWSARHWQWLFSFPADSHPLADTAPPEAGQSGNVWFLGGTFSSIEIAPGVIYGQANRSITIPSGTSLFFPIVDVEGSDLEGNGTNADELSDYAGFFADFIVPGTLSLKIDGKPVTNLTNYRVQSPLFSFGPLPDNNLLGVPEGSIGHSVSDGVFAMVKPLSVGTHTIQFYGELDLASIGGPTFIQDISYTVVVKPCGR